MSESNNGSRWSVVFPSTGTDQKRRQLSRAVKGTKKEAEAVLRRLIAESKRRGGGFGSDKGPAPEVTRGDE